MPIRLPPKRLDRVQLAVRRRHLGYRTEESYVAWVRRFIPDPSEAPSRRTVWVFGLRLSTLF
jgi:hypothetical protein